MSGESTGARRQRRAQALYGPLGLVLIGLTLLAVFVSYTANRGLPFQPTYRVLAEVPNADRLIATNEVRIGGVRVGQVSGVTAMPGRGGAPPYARLELALDPSVGRLPVDTRVQVRAQSTLGATYVALTLGHSRRTIPDGGRLPLRNARSTVDLVDLFGVFDRSTARNIRETLVGLGGGFASRGTSFNVALGALARMMPPATDVARVLAAPATRLADFNRGYASFVRALGPVSDQLAGVMTGGSVTFGALERVRTALADTIERFPPTETTVTAGLTRVQPALTGLAKLSTDLRPGVRLIPRAFTDLDTTLDAGVAPMRATPPFAAQLRATMADLAALTRLPDTAGSVRRLGDVLRSLGRTLDVLTPAQVYCNGIGLFGDNTSAGSWGAGSTFPMINVASTHNGNNDSLQSSAPSSSQAINYLPHADVHECESGNEPYDGTQQLDNPPGYQSRTVPRTYPPPGALERARQAGLLDAPPGTP